MPMKWHREQAGAYVSAAGAIERLGHRRCRKILRAGRYAASATLTLDADGFQRFVEAINSKARAATLRRVRIELHTVGGRMLPDVRR